MGNIETPDTIGSLPRSRNELVPGAKGLSVYQGGTRADVAEAPKSSNLSNLGNAISDFSATTGVMMVREKAQKDAMLDRAKGNTAAEKAAQDKTVKGINDMVSKGLLDVGASPTAIFAAQTNFAKLRGEQSQMRAREDYYANNDLRNSDDPAAFEQWASKWRQDNSDAILKDKDGKPRFTDLELDRSKFHGRVQDGLDALRGEHIAHRTAEMAKFSEQTASNLGTTRLENILGTGDNLQPHEERNYEAIGRALKDVYYGATGQASYGGMNKSKAADAMRDIIIDKAVAENDPHILHIAEHIDTPGGTLDRSKDFIGKATEAKLKIAGNVYSNEIRKEQIGKMNVEGTFDQRMEAHRANYEATQHEAQKKRFVEAATSKALQYPDLQHMTPQQLQEQTATLDVMRQFAPEETMKLTHTLQTAREHWTTQGEKKRFPLNEMHTWNALLKDPGSPATNAMIDQGLRDELYSGDEWRRLRAESDKAGQDKMKFAHILNNKLYTNLEDNVGKAVYKDPEHPLGAESVYAGQAMFEFRSRAIAFAMANPNANALDVATVMEPQLEAIAKRYNKTAAGLIDSEHEAEKGRQAVIKEAIRMSQTEVQKELGEQVKKAEVQTQQFKDFDAGKGPDPREANKGTFSSKNEAKYQSWKKRYADSKLTDAELRTHFKEGKTPQ